MGIENAGIVKQDIEAFEGAHRLLHCAPAFVGLANVGAQKDYLAPTFQYLRGHGMATLLIATGDGNFRSFFGEEVGCRLANAGGTAGDKNDSVLQASLRVHSQPDSLKSTLIDVCALDAARLCAWVEQAFRLAQVPHHSVGL
jgi:hypothetical protein